MSKPDGSYRGRPGRKPYRRFRSVGSVLPRIVKQLNLQEAVAVQPAVTLWPEIAGDKIARHARALFVDRKTLVVAVDGPTWMTQLTFLRPQILRKISSRIGKGLIEDVRFVPAQARPVSP